MAFLKTSMRILHFLSQTQLTGAETHVQTLVQEQLRLGHQVWVFSEKIHVAFPCPVHLVKVAEPRFFEKKKLIADFRKFLLAEKIDLVHCHSRAAVRIAHAARKNLMVAQVSTLHGRQHFSWSKKFFDLYGEYLIAICANAKAAHQKDFGTAPEKIKVLKNPISVEGYSVLENSHPLSKAAYIGRATGPKGLFFAELVQALIKDPDFLKSPFQIDIWAHQQEAFPESLHAATKKYPEHFKLCGASSNLQELYSQYGLVIGAGRVAIEAVLRGTAVFAMGETEVLGILNSQNLDQAWDSNFGDISVESKTINWAKVAQDFIHRITSGAKPSEALDLSRKMRADVKSSHLVLELDEIYKAAIFKRHCPQWLPALMYHKVPKENLETRHRIFVTADKFRKHLHFLKSQNFTSLSFLELSQFWNLKRPYNQFPKKPLLLTFDDGYEDNLTNAEPLLRKYGFTANLFLLADEKITQNTWDIAQGEKPHQLMDSAQRKMLDLKIWHIGSHGFSHKSFPELSAEQLLFEMDQSREQLKNSFQQEVVSIAYPFGHIDERCAPFAKKAGYHFAVNTDQGGLLLSDAPHSIFRVNIFPEDGVFQIWKKTRPWYRNYFFKKRNR